MVLSRYTGDRDVSCLGAMAIGFLALTAVLGLNPSARATPLFDVGDTGTFGHPFNWDTQNASLQLTDTDQAVSSRFTAFEDITIDAIWQTYRAVGAAGNVVRVSVFADDGNGLPTGPALASGTVSPAIGAGFGAAKADLDGDVSLVSENVYHVVTSIDSFDPGETGGIQVARSNMDTAYRPFDKAADSQFSTITTSNVADWSGATIEGNDPSFIFENDGAVIGGPGNPYYQQRPNMFTARGDGTTSGQVFTINGNEIPEGSSVEITEVTLNVNADNSNEDLIAEIRHLDGTVLGTANFTDSVSGVVTASFDTTVTLDEGVSYLLALRVDSTNASDTFSLAGQNGVFGGEIIFPNTIWGPATTGGNVDSTALDYPVRSTDQWGTFSPDLSWPAGELFFELEGVVVPEPGSLSFVTLGALCLLYRLKNASDRRQENT